MERGEHHQGGCLCGGVAFETQGPLRAVVACHCSQCRQTSGHVWAATSVALDRFRLIADTTLGWYDSSTAARRGFCRRCGASLFWKPAAEERIAIAAGALDGPTGLALARHIHVEDAGDYYAPEGPPPAAAAEPPLRLDCGCLCGGVSFELPGPAGAITACHCTQCRKLSGHFSASFDAQEAAVLWHRRETLAEYETPAKARRGFCTRCGSSLWFRSAEGAFSIEAGAVRGATGGRLSCHIFTRAKGDYYEIDDGLPQSLGD
ncbi:GFA family protein [Albidovulum sediminicola]|uniref:GFA family protein n=1 Tax=Albidovulum sediminicola TaxID=2984331 RepID=A0ABT2YYC1_9RHOB|nr:GFA family protein [Defluviimonas sp. WL0075]MCV2863869.1 GFA family protein [Defluviimonas sp. WL0075]